MNYKECIEYLYNCAPLFQNIGKDAYKEGLDNTLTLDKHFNHPHRKFKSIHIAGTNGKGSCSHTIASILQSAGYKVGLYTSPHLVDFRERIRINGEMIPEESVIEFVTKEKEFFEPLHPSFFELTTALAFKHFADMNVDIAVIETGLGGRLDCTNIITPELSIITNISFDHTQFLGNTIDKIAKEKAGIIKSGVPVVIGESVPESKEVFIKKATEEQSPIIFADESDEITEFEITKMNGIKYTSKTLGVFHGELGGEYQIKNTATIISAITELRKSGIDISTENIIDGFKNITQSTGLMGRWQTVNNKPLTICDTGHNIAGISYIVNQLKNYSDKLRLRIVFGMVNDKDINGVLKIMPTDAEYYFCQAKVKRAKDSSELKMCAEKYGLIGNSFATVGKAYEKAIEESDENDMVFVGGSSFIVADLLSYLREIKE